MTGVQTCALPILIAAPKQADYDRLRVRLEDTLRTRLLAAIGARRWNEVQRDYTVWQDASVRLGSAPATRTAVANQLDGALRTEFDTAIAAYDRSVAEPALPLFKLIEQPIEFIADVTEVEGGQYFDLALGVEINGV